MSVTYTYDVFCTLDGYGSYNEAGDWGGFWGKEGPEFLDHRLGQYNDAQRWVLGANTFRMFQRFFGGVPDSELDPLTRRFKHLPATVVSSTLEEPLDWPDATVERGDGVEIVTRLKSESSVPLLSHGSITLNRALLDAGLVDVLQVTVFPVISGQTGAVPVFANAADFDLELLSTRTFDGRIQELVYRPTLH